jgi:hypothetical protein
MKDYIGRPLEPGDFVTAVWANGDLAVFRVLKEKNCKQSKYFRRAENLVILERLDGYETASKAAIKKRSSQVTKITEEDYILYRLSRKN